MFSRKEVVLENIDKETVKKIIEENSIGSKYYENEQRKQVLLNKRIEARKREVELLQPDKLASALLKADEVLRRLEGKRNLSRTMVHVDMDAFYASVEILSKPHLAHVPMAVGSDHMLLTSNYKARSYGVRSAMPGFIARKLCPSLVIVSANLAEYERCSALVSQVLTTYNPHFSKVGLDEAYLDITEVVDERMQAVVEAEGGLYVEANEQEVRRRVVEKVVEEMRDKIFQATKLTASAGIAPNSMLAKVCSDMKKPNGQFTVAATKQAVMAFIRNLPVRKINGVGRVTAEFLRAEGVESCGDLIDRRAYLYLLNHQHYFNYLMRIGLAVGIDDQHQADQQHIHDHIPSRKSMSVERTFESTDSLTELMDTCFELCHSLVQDLLSEQLLAKGLTLKLKSDKFEVSTRGKLFACHCCHFDAFYQASSSLLKQHLKQSNYKIRLMGVRASNFVKADKVKGMKGQKRIIDFFKKSPLNSITQCTQDTHNSPLLQPSSSNPSSMKGKKRIIDFFKKSPLKSITQCTQDTHNSPLLQPSSSNPSNTEAFENSDNIPNKRLKVDVGVVDDNGVGHKDTQLYESSDDSYDVDRFKNYCEGLRKEDNALFNHHQQQIHLNNQHNLEISNSNRNNDIKCAVDKNNVLNDNDTECCIDNGNDDSYDCSNNDNNGAENVETQKCNEIVKSYDFKNKNNVTYIYHDTYNVNDTYVGRGDSNGATVIDVDEEVECPVCSVRLSCTSNHELNQHIDECLNLQFIRQPS